MSALIPQRRIGLTGGIASGKSSVGKLLQEKYGLLVLDADRYARAALAPGTTASKAVLKRYEELNKSTRIETIVLMIPLLFEAGLESLCTEIWLVDCDENQQLERLIARDICTNEQALARINAQWPLARKRLLADRLINNRGSSAELENHVALALDHPEA